MPTGSGKTPVTALVANAHMLKYRKVLVVVDLKTLLDQTHKRFYQYGLFHSVIHSSYTNSDQYMIQLTMAQTLRARLKNGTWWFEPDVIIVDEAHHVHGAIWDLREDLIYKGKKISIIAATATPITAKLVKRLAGAHLVCPVTTRQLWESKDLVKPTFLRSQRKYSIDMTGKDLNSIGEYRDEDISERTGNVIGGFVPTLEEVVRDYFDGNVPRTLIFTHSIDYAIRIAEVFTENGHPATQVGANNGSKQDADAIEAFERGDKGDPVILVCVAKLTKGFDVPAVSLVMNLRPLGNSLSTHLQILGRMLRVEGSKELAVFVDCTDNTRKFGAQMWKIYNEGFRDLNTFAEKNIMATSPGAPEITCEVCQKDTPRPTCVWCGNILPLPEYKAKTTEKFSLDAYESTDVVVDLTGAPLSEWREAIQAHHLGADGWMWICSWVDEKKLSWEHADEIFENAYGNQSTWMFVPHPNTSANGIPDMVKTFCQMVSPPKNAKSDELALVIRESINERAVYNYLCADVVRRGRNKKWATRLWEGIYGVKKPSGWRFNNKDSGQEFPIIISRYINQTSKEYRIEEKKSAGNRPPQGAARQGVMA